MAEKGTLLERAGFHSGGKCCSECFLSDYPGHVQTLRVPARVRVQGQQLYLYFLSNLSIHIFRGSLAMPLTSIHQNFISRNLPLLRGWHWAGAYRDPDLEVATFCYHFPKGKP